MERYNLKSSIEFGYSLKDKTDYEYRQLRDSYDSFLKQPLNLGMFVPCDEDGNVISKFYSEKENTKNLTFSQLSNQYQIAETKVLFEGVKFERIGGVNFLKINEDTFAFHDFEIKFKNLTVKFLVQYNLQLTESAIKQIGL